MSSRDSTFILELDQWDAQHGTVTVRARRGEDPVTPTYEGVQINYLARPTREDPDNVRAYGMDLYHKLFVENEKVSSAYRDMVVEARPAGVVHVRLEIHGHAPELHAAMGTSL